MKKIQKVLVAAVLPLATLSSTVSFTVSTVNNKSTFENQKSFYKFQSHIAESKEQLLQDVIRQTAHTNYEYEEDGYLLDNQYFDNTIDYQKYLDQNFKISQRSTILNPNDYVINNSDELNPLVANNQNSNYVKVYQGLNDQAYKDQVSAQNTYHQIQKVYDVNDMVLYNQTDAQAAYAQMLESDVAQVETYKLGAVRKSKQQILDWLVENQATGFTFNNKLYSDYNYSQFKNDLDNLGDKFYDHYIQQVADPDQRSYWLTDYHTNSGYYMGPKYIVTSENLTNAKFEVADTYTPNLIFGIASLATFFTSIGQQAFDYQSKSVFDWSKHLNRDYPVVEFINSHLVKNKFINEQVHQEFLDFYNKVQAAELTNVFANPTTNLANIHDKDFGDLQKMFVAFNGVLTTLKIIGNINLYQQGKAVFKDIVLSVLKTNNNVYDKMMNEIFQDVITPQMDIDDFLDFDDLFNFFMDPNKFEASDAGGFLKKVNIMKRVEGFMDRVIVAGGNRGAIGLVNELINIIKEESAKKQSLIAQDPEAAKTIDNETLGKQIGEVDNKLTQEFTNNADEFIASWGLEDHRDQQTVSNQKISIDKINKTLKTISFIWSIAKAFSFVDWVTFNLKIDEHQSGSYIMPVYKIPLLGIKVGKTHPEVSIAKLTDSIIDYLPVRSDGTKINKLWEIKNEQGTYYSDKKDAEDQLVKQIRLTPERYLPTENISASLMDVGGTIERFKLPSTIQNKLVVADTQVLDPTKQVGQSDYDQAMKEARLEFANQMFDKTFAKTAHNYYLDGFGQGYETKQEALFNMQQKLNKNQFKNRYEYKDTLGQAKYFDSLDLAKNYIDEHQIINSKYVLGTDLLKTQNYSLLTGRENNDYKIYQLDFYGQAKYFGSEQAAKRYLLNNLHPIRFNDPNSMVVYDNEGEKFYGTDSFKQYILSNIEVLTEDEYNKLVNEGGIHYGKIN